MQSRPASQPQALGPGAHPRRVSPGWAAALHPGSVTTHSPHGTDGETEAGSETRPGHRLPSSLCPAGRCPCDPRPAERAALHCLRSLRPEPSRRPLVTLHPHPRSPGGVRGAGRGGAGRGGASGTSGGPNDRLGSVALSRGSLPARTGTALWAGQCLFEGRRGPCLDVRALRTRKCDLGLTGAPHRGWGCNAQRQLVGWTARGTHVGQAGWRQGSGPPGRARPPRAGRARTERPRLGPLLWTQACDSRRLPR